MGIPTTPTITLTEAAEILGVAKSTAYQAAREGTFPVKLGRVGTRYIVPTKPLLEFLGLDNAPEEKSA
ncbi:helix-turn-helix transcriptional regulator [Corynebacterium sp. S7]